MNKPVHARTAESFGPETETRTLILTFAISMICHAAFFAFLIVSPEWRPQKKFIPSVINVSMVNLPSPENAPRPVAQTAPPPEPQAAENVENATPATPPAAVPEPSREPVVSIEKKSAEAESTAPAKKKPKRSLKKKTFQRAKILKSAIKRIEKDIGKSKPDPVKTAIERLRQRVGDKELPVGGKPREDSGAAGQPNGIANGANTRRVLKLIDIYRIEIAYQIQKNWAFSEQLAGTRNDLKTSLVFKVLPNGEIQDIFFTDRSGNSYLDESAFRAIKKSSPVKPHPEGVRRDYVEVGLRFTPEGIN